MCVKIRESARCECTVHKKNFFLSLLIVKSKEVITSIFDNRIDTLLMSAGLIKSLLKSQSILRLSLAFVYVSAEKYPVDSESVWKSKNIFF